MLLKRKGGLGEPSGLKAPVGGLRPVQDYFLRVRIEVDHSVEAEAAVEFIRQSWNCYK